LIAICFASVHAWRHRGKVHNARWIPAWKISLVLIGIVVLVLVILV
jgi:hypothetical protein